MHVVEHAITDDEIPTGGGKDVKGNILTFVNPVFNAIEPLEMQYKATKRGQRASVRC